MDFTISTDTSWDKSTLTSHLKTLARSPSPTTHWEFADKIGIPVNQALNVLRPQIIDTDDKDLISIFRRAVRNYNTCKPKEQADPVPLYNKHYEKPPFLIPKTDVTLDVREDKVIVTAEHEVTRNSNQTSLVLDAKDHQVVDIFLNGKKLDPEQYTATKHEIIIDNLPDDQTFQVKTITEIDPFTNDSLQGLYKCGEWLTTQCESESARRIFPTLDRPDVLSRYTTTIIADPKQYPHRISNGNLVSESVDEKGRATIMWKDPFPKPSYLFATVMGEFGVLKDTFITRSGNEVQLEVYLEKGKEKRGEYALEALKRVMKFEEEYYNREYDLDYLKLVAMPAFNMGGMENKGLIIFNESSILVNPDCASDSDFKWVEEVIYHEYAHNWSGNRVTVRNWFELALKEAFTDFRCMQFSEHRFGKELSRPKQAEDIRERQFPQDASKAAHPIQVESYTSLGDIYDKTTYVKGREVFRMLQTLLDSHTPGWFKKAQDAYFERYDGQAVTFRELLTTLQEVSGIDLTQFERWFHQPGTPKVTAELNYDPEEKVAKIHLKQTCPDPRTDQEQEPFHIPLNMELLDENGNSIVPTHLVELTDREQVLTFEGVDKPPIPVFHHDFSAPIHMEYDYSNEQLKTIAMHEKDPFARQEAIQIYLKNALKKEYDVFKQTGEFELPLDLVTFYKEMLSSPEVSHLSKAALLDLISLRKLVEEDETYDFATAHQFLRIFKDILAEEAVLELVQLVETVKESPTYDPNSPNFNEQMAIRKLRNCCFNALSAIQPKQYYDLIFEEYEKATNFNNQSALLHVIMEMHDSRKEKVLNEFYEKWKGDETIFRNWIRLYSNSESCTIETLDKVFNTPGFNKKSPNHMRSLIRVFVNNLGAFHSNYELNFPYVTERILEFGEVNPSVASSYLVNDAFKDFAKLPPKQKAAMKQQLQRLTASDVHEDIRAVAQKHLDSE